jgi:outer membrane immunogenic protein
MRYLLLLNSSVLRACQGGNVMKKVLLIGASIAALTGGSALAADIPLKAPPQAAVWGWSGFYTGTQAGIGWGDVANSFQVVGFSPTAQPDYRFRGGVAGSHAGFNLQYGQFVLGFEGDYDWANITGNDNGLSGVVDTTTITWMASARGRLGIAWNQVLLYGTGGYAWANARYSLGSAGVNNQQNDTIKGWTAGGGLEWMLDTRWSVRAEYRFTKFDEDSLFFAATAGNKAQTIRFQPDLNVVRVGISYRWGTPTY